jgi:hypothetical protein
VTTDAFKDALKADPFRPLTIHLSGRTMSITHPEQVVFAKDDVSAVIVTPDGHIHIVDVRKINGLELRSVRRQRPTED